ncbi:unnamed protein product, partial [Hapterophycus canaliculatus]
QLRTAVPAPNIPLDFKDRRSDQGGEKKKPDKHVRVPKFRRVTKSAERPAPIDSVAVMRRKRAGRIQQEQAAARERIEHYRPPYIKEVGEGEKFRLAEKFEFGGGKALPEEMTGPVMPIPSEARWKAAEEKRIAGVIRRRNGLPDIDDGDLYSGEGGGPARGGASAATTMFDQVANEIEERQNFLLEAKESGAPLDRESEARIMGEISLRMGELKQLTTSPGS